MVHVYGTPAVFVDIKLWIKVRYNQNTFTGLEFEDITIFKKKIC